VGLNRDKYGIIGQIQPNGEVFGGDSACWMGAHTFLTHSTFPYVKTFEKGFGGYVRHPHADATPHGFGAHYKNPWNGCMSRDQLTGTLGALIRQKERMALIRLVLQHACRGFLFSYKTIHNGKDPSLYKFNLLKFFYNPDKEPYYKMPDATFFDFWATCLRGFGKFSWLFWPLLCVLDIHTLLNAIIVNATDDDDRINFSMKLLVSREFVPTPISWLAAKIINKKKLLASLHNYWFKRDNSDMYPLYENRINQL